MKNTTFAIIVLILSLAVCPLPADAKCNWPVTEQTGAFDRNAYAQTASKMDEAGIKKLFLDRHDLLNECLTSAESMRYFCSVALVMGRYGRTHCDWKAVGKGSADRNEHLQFAKGKDLKELRAILVERFDELAKCLDRPQLDALFADLAVLQDDHVLIGR